MSEEIELVELKPLGYKVTYSTHDYRGNSMYSSCRAVEACGSSREEAIENCFQSLRNKIDSYLRTEVVTPDGDYMSLDGFSKLPKRIPANCGIVLVAFGHLIAVPLQSQVRVTAPDYGGCGTAWGAIKEKQYTINKILSLSGTGLENRLKYYGRSREDYFHEAHFPKGSFIGKIKDDRRTWSKLKPTYTDKSWEDSMLGKT